MKASNFQELVQKRKKWVEVSKENNFDFDCILAGLYNDPSHFIYEILQNAEDEEATEVAFELFEDGLNIYHNGENFNFQDIEGVTGIGVSTKKDEVNTIGKFGVGFKSVFAITQTPLIHSGDYHIKIEDFVVPSSVNSAEQTIGTKFTLPFNHKFRSKDEIFELVKKKLENIGLISLLFLRNIEEIKWSTPYGNGHYLKSSKNQTTVEGTKRVTIIAEAGGKDSFEEYFVFERTIKIEDKPLKVEVAFKIGNDKDGKEIILPVTSSKLVVFFPTEKPTYLNFLIQGPYKTTPNRENIPLEDEQNKAIIEETSMLVAESTLIIKRLGYLDINFLNVLPIDPAHLEQEPIYASIFSKVKTMLGSDVDLLPTSEGAFASAKDSVLARGIDLTELLKKDDIDLLFSKHYWLDTAITKDSTKVLWKYLINELKIKEIEFADFVKKISTDFMESKSDEWLIAFYHKLSGQRSLWSHNGSILRTKPIVRLEDNTHKEPYDSNGNIQVYLPAGLKSEYPTVKKAIIEDDGALKFCENLGLRKPDLFAEIVEKILPKYIEDNSVDDNEYYKDFDKVISFFNECESSSARDNLIEKLSKTCFILSTDHIRKYPSKIYQNTPELLDYFDGFDSASFVSDELNNRFYGKKLSIFLKEIGVPYSPLRKKLPLNLSKEEKSRLRDDKYATRDIAQFDYDLEGLDNFLSQDIDVNKSSLLWKSLLNSIESLRTWEARHFFEGQYRWQYHNIYTELFDAKFIKKLQSTPWLVNKSGDLMKPSEVTLMELSDEYSREATNIDVLKEKLRFKPDAFDQLPDYVRSKLELLKDYSVDEIKGFLTSVEKSKGSGQSTEANDDVDWTPECNPEDIDTTIEDTNHSANEPPQFEGQSESLSPDKNGANKDVDGDSKMNPGEMVEKKQTTKKLKQIGDWGEKAVLKALRKYFAKEGSIEDTEFGFQLRNNDGEFIEVFWLNKASNVGKGYDFVIKRDNIEKEYIEVKSKIQEEAKLIMITGKQWEFARKLYDQGDGGKYWIYTVVNVGTPNAKIKKISNPIKLWKDGKLYAHPVRLEL